MRLMHRARTRILFVLALLALLLLSYVHIAAARGQPDALFAHAISPAGHNVSLSKNTIRMRFVRINPARLGAAEGQGPVAGRARFPLTDREEPKWSPVAPSLAVSFCCSVQVVPLRAKR